MPPTQPARLFFLHILKTGGTSFYRFLENNYARNDSIRDDRFAELHALKADREAFFARLASLRLITKLHLDYAFVAELKRRDPAVRVVTLLRQPVQRCFSMIEHWRRVPEVHMASLDAVRRELVLDARRMLAADFVEKHADRLSDHQTKMLGGVADHVADPPREELLATARANLASITYVGLTERMAETAACLASAMGFYNSINSQPLNVTRDDRRLTAAEKEQIRGPLAALNRCDTILYADGELRFWRMLSRWKLEQAQAGSAQAARPLALGETFRLSMDDPLVGDGWHEREGGPEQSCRWAGPERLSSLFLPVSPRGQLEIRITVLSVISDEVLAGLQLFAAGLPVPHRVSHQDQRLVITATADLAESSDDWLDLTLCFPTTRSAYNVAAIDDHRQKTIAVETVEVQRLSSRA